MKHLIVACLLMVNHQSIAIACDNCGYRRPVNKVNVINKLAASVPQTKSQYSLQEQFELQRQLDPILAPFLKVDMPIPQLRRFEFRSNLPEYTGNGNSRIQSSSSSTVIITESR